MSSRKVSLQRASVRLALATCLFSLPLLAVRPAGAQQTFTGGGISLSSTANASASSTIAVSGASGTVATVKVGLTNVTTNANLPNQCCSMWDAQFILTSPDGRKFILLGNTGDSVDGDDLGDSGSGLLNVGLTIQDGATAAPDAVAWPHTGSLTVKPSSYWKANAYSEPTPSDSYPQSDGSSTLAGVFAGANPDGNWTLTVADYAATTGLGVGSPITVGSWSLTLTYNALVSSTTSVSTSLNPANLSNTVTFTAIVTGTAGTPSGTITFSKNGTNLSCTGGNPAPMSGGIATCSTSASALAQGLSDVTATYSGSTTYGSSSGSTNELVEVTPTQNGNTWCNSNSISAPNAGEGQAYPSTIKVTGYATGTTVADVTVALNNVSWLGLPGQHLLVSPDGQHNLDFLDQGWAAQGSTISPVTLTFFDTAGQTPNPGGNPSTGSYEPWASNPNHPAFPSSSAQAIDSTIPQVPGTINFAAPDGSSSNSFVNLFNNAPANGNWALYAYDDTGTPESIAGGWCITFDINTGVGTTTTVTSSANPATKGNSVTLTATVKETGSGNPVTSGGTVTFLDNNDTPAGTVSGNNVLTLNGSGQATFTTSSFAEGDHHITVTYNGDTSDNLSTGSMWQRVDNATTLSAGAGNSFNYCNTGAVSAAQAAVGPFTPNPSNLFVSSLPGTVNAVTLTLNSLSATGSIYETESLLESPTGAALDFFSNTSNSGSLVSTGNYTFSDSAGSLVGTGALVPGTYKPTAYQNVSSATDTFTSSSSGFYNAPSSFGYAAPHGSGTFASTFTGVNPNGTWSLFFNQAAGEGAISAQNGWCVNFTENAVTAQVAASHSGTGTGGDFVQGEQGAQITANITNEGNGPTGDPLGTNPLKVIDTLNGALTYTGYAGTGWSCSAAGQTVTCTNDSVVAQSASYPSLTLNVNVAANASSPLSNQVSVSGAGVTSTSGTDSIVVDPAPVLALSKSHTGTFTQGSTAEWDLTVVNSMAGSKTQGTITVSDTLPLGYTLNSSSSTGNAWGCGAVSNTVTCTSSTSIAGGGSSSIALIVNVPANSPISVSNIAAAYGGGDLTHTSQGTAALSNSDSVTVAQVPASIAATSGSGQSAIDTTAFTNPLVATVTDAGGVAIQGAVVTFTAPAQTGASVVFAGGLNTVTTNASGMATSAGLTANSHLGTYSVIASVGAQQTTFQLTNTIGPLAQIVVAAPSSTIAGVPLQFTVAAEDAGGNVETGFADTIHFTSSDSSATLPANAGLAGGTGTFSATLNTLGNQTVTATDTTTPISGSTAAITVNGVPNLVVTVATDDAGAASNCTTQASASTGTDASCSLRDALLESASLGAANVSFDSTKFSSATTITLTNGTLLVPAYTAIHGPTSGSGAGLTNLLTVNGNNLSAVFSTSNQALMASISNLTVTGGAASGGAPNGGAVYNAGSLTLTSCTITGNSATGSGGGIDNSGTLTVVGSTIAGNTGQTGGGINNENTGTLTMVNSTLTGNSASGNGGGFSNAGSTALTNSTFSGNFAGASGGGIYSSGSALSLGNSIVSGNRLGTASSPGNYDDLDDTTSNSVFTTGNNGGNVIGLYNAPSATPPSPAINLSPLSNNGGPTQILLPLPASPAICGGVLADIASGVTTDQRGLPNKNTTYPGYSSGTPCVDSGAVQTNYSVAFTQQPTPISPATSLNYNTPFTAAVTLSESGVPATNGVTIPLSLQGRGQLTGGSAATAAGVASYSALQISHPGEADILTAGLTLNGALQLSAASSTFAVGGPPFGAIQAIDARTKSTTIAKSDNMLVVGWAADVQQGAPISRVEVRIDGTLVGDATLGVSRPDVPAFPNSGFTFTFAASKLSIGKHTVTVTGYDSIGLSSVIGSQLITVGTASEGSPFGWVDQAVDATTKSSTVSQADNLLVRGWAADVQDGAPVANGVQILIDGVAAGSATLGLARPDVKNAYNNAAYLDSGWTFTLPASGLTLGTHTVSAVATDSVNLSTTLLGTKTITVGP